jgi:hypothetical protein
MNGRLWVWFLVGAAVLLGLWLLAWGVPLAINATFEATLGPSGLLGRAGQRELAGVRSEIRPGMSRQVVYDRLRARNLVASNSSYAIDRRDPKTGNLYIVREGDWPPESFTAIDVDGKSEGLVTHPQAYVTISIGSTAFGCSRDVDLTIEFDAHDLVKRMLVEQPHDTCM